MDMLLEKAYSSTRACTTWMPTPSSVNKRFPTPSTMICLSA